MSKMHQSTLKHIQAVQEYIPIVKKHRTEITKFVRSRPGGTQAERDMLIFRDFMFGVYNYESLAYKYDLTSSRIGGIVKNMHKNVALFKSHKVHPKVPVVSVIDEISLCKECYCMTKTIDGKCGKCGAAKND